MFLQLSGFSQETPGAEHKSLYRSYRSQCDFNQTKGVSDMASDTATYTYDSLGRIKTVTFTNGTVITYNYDAMGNRTSVVTTCGGGGC